MCTIEKMLVKGIRSFSPDNNNVIEFYKPLTLIVGSNGAGKTTIIECLKQACTGELPPNVGGNGRNWVMDPKVAGETEVKAQIKLRLRTSVQMPFVVVRSFQSVQKKATLQFKSLDATLQTYNKDTHQKEAITYRCADINTMVPTLMGVSKAVLDNVIFVHQEESNWPLADGATIKKKFDEIFAATKYTKALESLRKLRLEKTQEGRELKLKLETLRSHKDAAQGLQRDAAEGAAKAEALLRDINALQAKIEAHDNEMAALDEKLNQLADMADGITKLQAQLEVVKKATLDKLARLDEGDFEEDDATLEDYKQNMEKETAEANSSRDAKSNNLKVKQMDAASYEDSIQQAQQQLNRLQAAEEAHASNVAARDEFVAATAAKMGIQLPGLPSSAASLVSGASFGGVGGAGGPLSAAVVDAFLAELRGRQAQLRGELASMRETHRSQEAALNDQIDTANNEVARAQQAGHVKQQDLQLLERRRENLNQQVIAMAAAPYQAEELQLQEEELSRKLEAKRAEEGRQGFDAQLAQQRAALERISAEMTTLRAERDRVIMAGDASTRLRAARSALAASRAKLDALMQGSGAKQLLELVGNPSPVPHGVQLKRLADERLKVRESEVKARGEELRTLEAELAKLSGELTSKRRERVSAEAQCQRLRAELRRAVGSLTETLHPDVLTALQNNQEDKAFETALAHMDKVRGEKFAQQAKSTSLSSILGIIEDEARRECKCMMCNRAFTTQEQLEEMLNYVAQQQTALPEQQSTLKQAIDELDRQLAGLNNMHGSVQSLRQLESGLPGMKASEEDLAGREATHTEQLEHLRDDVAIMEADLMALRRTVADAGWSISKQANEVDELSVAADKAAAAAATAGGEEMRSMEELDSELAELERQQRTADMTRDDLMRRQARIKDERVRLSEQLAAVREELRRASEANRAKLETQSQLKDVDEQIVALQGAIAAANAAVGPARANRDNLLAQRDAMRQQQLAAEGSLEAQIKQLASACDGFTSKQRLVDDYGAAAKEEEMQQLAAHIEDVKAKREACAQKVAKLRADLEDSAQSANQRASLMHNIEAVLDYRRSRRQEVELQQQVDSFKAAVAEVGDRQSIAASRDASYAAKQEAQRQRDLKQGSLGVVREHVHTAQRGLQDARYQGIYGRYRQQQIELKTTELAAADLDKYHKALERALLVFHTGKMSDINKIVKELWQKTYRGQDIDYIQIKADAEGTARSYNYRVVMVNGGVELDMRGRCSAGQKVLACLIIRLALAETFCLNCGILALDEPTTNLDAENSASLADALRAVMASRREQDNFQLIVITHDEHFAHLIGTRQHAEYLWRITKDDNQRSHIAQEEIVE